ncbi:MAG: HAD hydrolase family protein [Dehalococcoidales bacterium]|nr:HAD hydrolase family protein [Dehalococcoidales bacterium]
MGPRAIRVKAEGLFLDYDGTIGPVNVPREESAVSKETVDTLYRIKQLVPIGIITTKSLPFIISRTPFASAWCGVAGLETKIGDEECLDAAAEKSIPLVSLALKKVRELSQNNLYIEEKCDLKGRVLAFCVDWRYYPEPQVAKKMADQAAVLCKSMGLVVDEYPNRPFFDVYPCRVDKGKALSQLKSKLGVKKIMYLGDSKADNTAFEVADIGIGVLHEESVSGLLCDYYIKFEEVNKFFRRLLKKQMVFDENFPEVSSNPAGEEI